MDSDLKQHSIKEDSAARAAPETGNVTKMDHVVTDMTERTANTPSLYANAAQKVFNTVSLG
jgi:hypothetical protein